MTCLYGLYTTTLDFQAFHDSLRDRANDLEIAEGLPRLRRRRLSISILQEVGLLRVTCLWRGRLQWLLLWHCRILLLTERLQRRLVSQVWLQRPVRWSKGLRLCVWKRLFRRMVYGRLLIKRSRRRPVNRWHSVTAVLLQRRLRHGWNWSFHDLLLFARLLEKQVSFSDKRTRKLLSTLNTNSPW